MVAIEPFSLSVPQKRIDTIIQRVRDVIWSYAPDGSGDWRYGTEVDWLRDFAHHWAQDYDWRAAEQWLNRWPQFITPIDGIPIHFYHISGSTTRQRALILTHGWPGSVVEFQDVIERLAFPERFGGAPGSGFDVIIPSLPGYGSSGRPRQPIGPRKVAAMWRTLMVERLGYGRFGAQGGDWGSAVASWLGSDHSDVVAGIHLNMVASWSSDRSPAAHPAEAAYRSALGRVQSRDFGYHAVQTHKPQTLAIALADSPVGFASWVIEKFHGWGDTGGNIDSRFSRDTLITNIMLYLVNDAVASSTWLYRGRAEEAAGGGADMKVDVPTGVALFPAEFIPYPPRDVAERTYNITRWQPMSAGGHFAALEEPVAFADEVHRFFDFL